MKKRMKAIMQLLASVLLICLIVEVIMIAQLRPLINKVKEAAYYSCYNDNPFTNTEYSNFQYGGFKTIEDMNGKYVNGKIDFKFFFSIHNFNKGHVWCSYEIIGNFENAGEVGIAKIFSSVWDIEKIDGKWEIVNIHEKP